MIPARFARPTVDKARGLIVYVMAIPLVAIILGLALSLGFRLSVGALGFEESFGESASIAGLVLGVGVTLVWGWADFRRMAGLIVEIHADRIEISTGGPPRPIRFEDIRDARERRSMRGRHVEFVLADGSRERLPANLATLHELRLALDESLTPILADRLEEALKRGESADFREGTLRALMRFPAGLLRMLAGAAVMMTIRLALEGLRVMSTGAADFVRGRRALRGGFCLTAEGVISPQGNLVAWDQIRTATLDEDGMVLQLKTGRILSASSVPPQAWAARHVMRRKLPGAVRASLR